MKEQAREILDTMLGYLGFVCEIKATETGGGILLQVYQAEADKLIGPRGETLDDIQYLLNRLLLEKHPDAPRVQVDVEHYREMREDGMLGRIRELADLVRKTGRPYHLDPMNSYDRRIVHHAFKDDPDIETKSSEDSGRVKRITLQRRGPAGADAEQKSSTL